MSYKVFTSESVCAGHPDKICDQISDAILDECLNEDPSSRVAIETLVTTNTIILAGEVTSRAKVNFEQIAREVVRKLGYDQKIFKFDYKSAKVYQFIHSQSPDIATGVQHGGAGDQGMMFGYACAETHQLMPLTITIAHKITKAIDKARETTLTYLRPDGKSEVTMEYLQGKPDKVLKVITAVPHKPKIKQKKLSDDIYEVIIRPILKTFGLSIDISDTICNGT